MKKIFTAVMVLAFAFAGFAAEKKEVNIYTDRHYETDQKLYDEFEKETGIKVNVLKGKSDELLERIIREGSGTNADIFITADAGRLHRAKEAGVLGPITSKVIQKNIPPALRDKDNQWIGLTIRARVIAYSLERVKPSELSTYEELTETKWKNRVVQRSSSNIYNQSLLASFIAINGEAKSKDWAKKLVENFTRAPKGSDRDQVKSIAAGEGDVAFINNYYFGAMINSTDKAEVDAAKKVGIFFPNQKTSGTHINVSGAGLSRYAVNKENAVRLIEFLTTEKAQTLFADANYEYPANSAVEASELLKSWGSFKKQKIDITILGENNAKAVKIFDEAGWK